MKFVLCIGIIVIAMSSLGNELPKHPFMKPLKLSPLASTNSLSISAEIVLPENHKLNRQAPSDLNIYERVKSEWKLLDTTDLKSIATVDSKIVIEKRIVLSSSNSEIALDSTIFHCDKKNTHCAIESFQGVAKRSPMKGAQVLVTKIQGSAP